MGWPFTGSTAPTLTVGPIDLPTTIADADATNPLWVMTMLFANHSGALRTVTVVDKATGATIMNAVTVPSSGLPLIQNFNLIQLGGVRWVASGSSVTGVMQGYK